VERLGDGAQLAAWLEQNGLGEGIEVSPEQLSEAIRLRETVFRLAWGQLGSGDAQSEDVDSLNRYADHPTPPARLVLTDGRLSRSIGQAGSLEDALAVLARDAIALLGGPDWARVKACEDRACRMLFIDSSRGGRRRWCSMSRCGNLAKVSSFRNRRLSEREAGGRSVG
jgi:predicted RNA-binding Zn ribbon-like protein